MVRRRKVNLTVSTESRATSPTTSANVNSEDINNYIKHWPIMDAAEKYVNVCRQSDIVLKITSHTLCMGGAGGGGRQGVFRGLG